MDRNELLGGARELGIRRGRDGIICDETTLDILMDYCLYDRRGRDRRNVVERFARSNATFNDEERRILDQMQQARFRLLLIPDPAENYVFQATDLFRADTINLIDINLSRSVDGGIGLLTRTVPTDLDDLWATTGAALPVAVDDVYDVVEELLKIVPKNVSSLSKLSASQWSEAARVSLRTALANGCAEHLALEAAGAPLPRHARRRTPRSAPLPSLTFIDEEGL